MSNHHEYTTGNRQRRSPLRSVTSGSFGQAQLYVGFGLVGAAIGAVAGELSSRLAVFSVTAPALSASFKTVLLDGLKLGIFASLLGFALLSARRHYRHRTFNTDSVVKTLGLSFLSGAFAGGVIQTLHYGWTEPQEKSTWVVDVATWLLLGALLASVIAKAAPQISARAAMAAGVVSGLMAGLVRFALSLLRVPPAGSAIAGLIALGAMMGLLIFIIDRTIPEPMVEVYWSPRRKTTVELGAQPVTIGGGEDDIFLAGAPPRVSTLVMQHGVIKHVETSTGKQTELRDGSRLRIGGVVMVVNAPEQ